MYYGYPPYERVADKKARMSKQLNKLLKKNPNWQPIILEGNTLANSWWGKSWNKNLERYADLSNRIGRGKSYLRLGAIFDLQINHGVVSAKVAGSGSSVYTIKIEITPLNDFKWDLIVKKCEGNIENLNELIEGSFPKTLEAVFFDKDEGLFPNSKEIKFSCSCPDYAYVCKHIAAVLYAIGSRLDNDPSLLFILRGVNIDNLITKAIGENVEQLLEKADNKTKRIIDDSDIDDLFNL